ncbi:hypothetical protein AB0G32_39180 [Streptomyces sp. NPDC023723]|uniref:hypothetical protein n=1 Tax=Streptomyces sp. NPDC023723 TaxID=3154323 RepID=UPI0033E4C72A
MPTANHRTALLAAPLLLRTGRLTGCADATGGQSAPAPTASAATRAPARVEQR